jgi:hypothetical protein
MSWGGIEPWSNRTFKSAPLSPHPDREELKAIAPARIRKERRFNINYILSSAKGKGKF